MTLTLLIDPASRTARLKEVSALAAGDVYDPLVLSGIPGADPGTLTLSLYRDASMRRRVATASAFAAVPGHARDFSASMGMSSAGMEAWFADATEASDDLSDDAAADDAEDRARSDGWLVVADATRVWAACRVPVVLRDVGGGEELPPDTVPSLVASIVAAALAGKADLVGGTVPPGQLPPPTVVSAANRGGFPSAGSPGVLYVALDGPSAWLWSGAGYVPAVPRVRPNWEESDPESPAYIENKPDMSSPAAAQVQADWDESDPESPAYVKGKPAIPRPNWEESDPLSPDYIAGKPGRARADWNESDPDSPSYIEHKPEIPSAQVQADWDVSDSDSPKYIWHKPTIPPAQVRANWEESDPDSPSYIERKPTIPPAQVRANWEESDPDSPSYIEHKPPVEARLAAQDARIAAQSAAIAGKQDLISDPVSLAALSSGITADKVAYFQRIAAIALGGGSAGYPFVEAAVTREHSGWTFAASMLPGVALAGPAPVRTSSGWSLFPHEAAAHGSPESGVDAGWEIEESESAASVTLSVPRSRTGGYMLFVFDDVVTLDPLPSASPYGSAKIGYAADPGDVVWRDSPRASLRSRSLPDGTTVWYASIPLAGGGALCSEEYLSLGELVAAMESGLPSGMYTATGDEASPAFEDEPEPTFRTVSSAPASDVVEVAPWTVAALVPDSVRPLRVVPGPLPDGVSGVQRDMFLVLDCEGLASVPAVAWDSAFDVFDGDVLPVAGEANIYRLTEYAEGRFSVRRVGSVPEQVQADWSESDSADPAFVRNRPDVVTKGFLLDGGKISSSLLPSYVDDVVEYSSVSAFPAEGETGKIYIDAESDRTYRWSGTQYVEIAASPVTSVNGQTGAVTLDIPSVDSALSSTSENPVQNKAVASALAGKRDVSDLWVRGVPSLQTPGWFACNGVLSERGTGPWQINLQDTYLTVSEDSEVQYTVSDQGGNSAAVDISSSDAEFDAAVVLGGVSYRVVGIVDEIAGSSDVANKQDALSSAQLAAVNSGVTAAKVATWDGYAAQIAAKANASDVATALAQKANTADLHYALVTPGEWDGYSIYGKPVWYPPYGWVLEPTGSFYQPVSDGLNPDAMRLECDIGEAELSVFTRASLPGHLLDRAGNRVVVSGDTTLTLPAANPGYLRDFLVRLEISGSTVPTITFSPDGNESVTYETDGDEFPVPDEAGNWLYSFTETAAHTFAVSLKKVNEVAQGGS